MQSELTPSAMILISHGTPDAPPAPKTPSQNSPKAFLFFPLFHSRGIQGTHIAVVTFIRRYKVMGLMTTKVSRQEERTHLQVTLRLSGRRMGAIDVLASREGQIVIGATVGFLTIFVYSFKDTLIRWGLGMKPFQAVGNKFLDKRSGFGRCDLCCECGDVCRNS